MHYGDEKLEQNIIGSSVVGFCPLTKTFLHFGPPISSVQNFIKNQNRAKIATVGARTDRQTDRQKDAGDFIICPVLCYCNGTDTRGRVRAGPSLQLGTLSTRIANLLCITLGAVAPLLPCLRTPAVLRTAHTLGPGGPLPL